MRVETQEFLNDAAKNLNTTNSKATLNSVAAILYKDAINSRRHGVILAFQTIFPLIMIILFYLSIGRKVERLPLSLVNLDNQNCSYDHHLNHPGDNAIINCPSISEILFGGPSDILSTNLANISCVLLSTMEKSAVTWIPDRNASIARNRGNIQNFNVGIISPGS